MIPRFSRHTGPTALIAATVVASSLLGSCDSGDGRDMRDPTEPLQATTVPETSAPATAPTMPDEPLQLIASWPTGADIPVRNTCDDANLSPALTWSGVPTGTVELAVTMTDIDADGFVHWIAFAIDPTENGLAEGTLPEFALEWVNDFGLQGYGGPCPPSGDPHRYILTLHALNQQLEVADDASTDEVIAVLDTTAIAQTSVTGSYARPE